MKEIDHFLLEGYYLILLFLEELFLVLCYSGFFSAIRYLEKTNTEADRVRFLNNYLNFQIHKLWTN